MFETPGQPSPGGGITLVKQGEFVPSKGKGGVTLYLYVADLEGWEEVCQDFILLLSQPDVDSCESICLCFCSGTFMHPIVLHQRFFVFFPTHDFPFPPILWSQHRLDRLSITI
jgi:hypothetical protein